MKRSSCIGVSVVDCDENNKELIELCKAGYGFNVSRRSSCVYEKKG